MANILKPERPEAVASEHFKLLLMSRGNHVETLLGQLWENFWTLALTGLLTINAETQPPTKYEHCRSFTSKQSTAYLNDFCVA